LHRCAGSFGADPDPDPDPDPGRLPRLRPTRNRPNSASAMMTTRNSNAALIIA